MTRYWQYPIHLIQHGGGYASIIDPMDKDQSNQSLAVFCDEQQALGFMVACEIMGSPRQINNDREFGWLLTSLHAPVAGVVFDPSPIIDNPPGWKVSVKDLLDNHLVSDNSPWNYPVYVVAQEQGFISIEEADNDGQPLTAIGFFTSVEYVETYLEAAAEAGATCPIDNVEEARSFLKKMVPQATAVAINPTAIDGQRTAKYCFAITTLLEKYLVNKKTGPEDAS